MSMQSSKGLIGTLATSFAGQFSKDYAKLFSQWFASKSEDPESWPLSVEDSLRKPTLGNVTFVLSYKQDEALEIAAMCQDLMDHGDDETKSKSWEMLARFLVLLLDQAQKSWIHPERLPGDLALLERHSGIVDRITGSVVVVRYGEGDDAFESEYDCGQFNQQISISRGDRIEAAIGLWHQKHQPRGIDHLLSKDEQKAIDAAWESRSGVVVGDVEI